MPGPTTISRGNLINTLVLQVNLTPVAVAGNSTVEQTFNINGLISSDQVSAFSFQGAYSVNVDAINFRVASANTLTVAFQNPTGSPVTPPAGNYFLEINRVENLPAPSSIT